jgi:ATP-binding cassette subfamily B protein
MTYTTTIQEFLASLPPIECLSSAAQAKLSTQGQLLGYGMGQVIVMRENCPSE